MERLPTIKTVANIDLDSYLSALPEVLKIDDTVMEDNNQMFYHWLQEKFPQFKNIDDVTIEELYIKNVLETGMSEANFFKYCNTEGIPVLASPDATDEAKTYYDFEFKLFLKQQELQKKEAYEIWAKANQIDSSPGAIMRFFDKEDKEYFVHTDSVHRGEIVT